MIKRALVVLAVAGSALVPAVAVAAAQPLISAPHWSDRPPPAPPRSMRLSLVRYNDFSACVVALYWPTIERIFDMPYGAAESRVILNRVLGKRNQRGTECLTAMMMRMTLSMERGGYAGARYRLAYGNAPVPPASNAIAPVPESSAFEWTNFGRESPERELGAFASCLARRERGAVHPVLMTRVGTANERQAMQELSRRFGTCLRPGQRLRAHPVTLRPWLAEAQLQLARGREPFSGRILTSASEE